ncbi:MAG: glutathione S-transferase family protein [Rhodobacteraceae bacterium]|nr:glutathione S-transferase family protein [Paracoccaceae bacterium]
MPYTLVSFDICPFVQKARILFDLKGLTYQTEYIDLANKPDWYLDRVPTGKVPALLHGDDVIFESNVILEYVDETTPGALLPQNAIERARERAWMVFVDDLIMAQYRTLSAQTWQDMERNLETLWRGFERLEPEIGMRRDGMLLLECAAAPLFSRIDATPLLKERFAERFGEASRIGGWAKRILSSPSVVRSLPDAFADRLASFFGKTAAGLFADAEQISEGRSAA